MNVPLLSCPADTDLLGLVYRGLFRKDANLAKANGWALADSHHLVWTELAQAVGYRGP